MWTLSHFGDVLGSENRILSYFRMRGHWHHCCIRCKYDSQLMDNYSEKTLPVLVAKLLKKEMNVLASTENLLNQYLWSSAQISALASPSGDSHAQFIWDTVSSTVLILETWQVTEKSSLITLAFNFYNEMATLCKIKCLSQGNNILLG